MLGSQLFGIGHHFKIIQSNLHLSTTATFFALADSPYIASCLNLSTTATATKACPQHNNLSTTASFFPDD